MIGGRNLRSSVMTSFGSGCSSHQQPVSSTNRNSQQKCISNISLKTTTTTVATASTSIGNQLGSKKPNIIEVTGGQFKKDKNVIKIQEKSGQQPQWNKGIGKSSYTALSLVGGSSQLSIKQSTPVTNNNQDAVFTSIPKYFNPLPKQHQLNSNNITGTIVSNYMPHAQQQHKINKSPYQQQQQQYQSKQINSAIDYQVNASNLRTTSAASNNSNVSNVNSNGAYQKVSQANFNLRDDAAAGQSSNQILVGNDNNNRQSIHKSNIEQRQQAGRQADIHGKLVIDQSATTSYQTKFIDFQLLQNTQFAKISNISNSPKHNLAPQQQQKQLQGQLSPLHEPSFSSSSNLSLNHTQQIKEKFSLSHNNSNNNTQFDPFPPVFYSKITPTTDSIRQDKYPLQDLHNKVSLISSEYHSPTLNGEIRNQVNPNNTNNEQFQQFTQAQVQNSQPNQQDHQLNSELQLFSNVSTEQFHNSTQLAASPYPSQQLSEEKVKYQKLSNFSQRVQSATRQFKNVIQAFNESSNQNMNEYHQNIQFLETMETQLQAAANEVTRNLKAQLLDEFNKSLSICKTGQFEVQQILGYLASTENDLTSNLESIVRDMDISSLDDIISQYEQVINQHQSILKDKISKYTYQSYSTIDQQAKGFQIQSLSKQLQSQLVEILRLQPYTSYILNSNQNNQQADNPISDFKHFNEISTNLLRKTGEFMNSNIEFDQQLPLQMHQPKSVFVSFENKDFFTNATANSSLKEPSIGQQQQLENNISQIKLIPEQNTNDSSPSVLNPFWVLPTQLPQVKETNIQGQCKLIYNISLLSPSDPNHSQQFSGGSFYGANPSTAANTLTEASCSLGQTQFTDSRGQNEKIKGIIDLYENLGDAAKAKRRMLSNQEATTVNIPYSINLWNSAEQPKTIPEGMDFNRLRAPISDYHDFENKDSSGIAIPIEQIPSFQHENQDKIITNNNISNISKGKHKYSELLSKIQVNQSLTEKLYSEVFLGQQQQQQQTAAFKLSLLEDEIPLRSSGQCFSLAGSNTNGSCKQ